MFVISCLGHGVAMLEAHYKNQGFGELRPMASNRSAAGKAKLYLLGTQSKMLRGRRSVIATRSPERLEPTQLGLRPRSLRKAMTSLGLACAS